MRKLLAALLVALACKASEAQYFGTVYLTERRAVAQGESLYVAWTVDIEADTFVLWRDAGEGLEPFDTTTDTVYTFGGPCRAVGVSTLNGEPTEIDLSPAVLDTVRLLSRATTDSGYFRVSRSTGEFTLYDSSGRQLSFGFVDTTQGELGLFSSWPQYTDEAGFYICPAQADSLGEMTLAPLEGWGEGPVPERFYTYVDECLATGEGWSALDLYGKAELIERRGDTLLLKVEWQTKVLGLRWLAD